MKNYKIKLKILVYGFPPLVEKCIIDNFELKNAIINEENIVKSTKKDSFSTAIYITSCSYRIQKGEPLYYNYFENIDYINVETDDTEDKIEIMHKANIINKIMSFQKKLRLQFNVRIIFPISRIEIYRDNDEFFDSVVNYWDFPIEPMLIHFDKVSFEHNSHFHFELQRFEQLEHANVKFERAINYFVSSFDSSNISLRYLLLFSSMEALLINSKKNITENLANRMSKILLYNDSIKEKDAYNKIKELYNIRSKYIHGSKKNIITNDNERDLRCYVREVLIIYWVYAINNKLGSGQIIKNIDNNVEVDFGTKTLARYLRVNDYKRAYIESCTEIANGILSGKFKIRKED